MKTGWRLPCSAAHHGFARQVGAARFCRTPQAAAVHPHLTQQLLWEEYRQANPDGYRYCRFCELYQRWRSKQDVVLRQEHKAGEKLFVDWAGTTIPIYDPRGGPTQQAHLFVAVLGASSYTYAEATPDEQLANWIGAHIRAFEFSRGVPKLVVPDNTKTGVTKACRYDPDLNPTYQEMAMHYGVGVVPARPYKPRDKAKVESGVQLAERWIIAALRHRKFFSIEELNQAIRELRDRINQRPFRKREGSRASQFLALDKPALGPLPAEPFDLSQWSRHGSTSTITSSSIPTTTAFPTTWCRSWWRSARRPRPSRFSTTASAWLRTCARVVMGTPSPLPSTVQDPPGASGMDSLAHGALGADHRSAHGASV